MVDPEGKAQIAMAKAYIRSQAKVLFALNNSGEYEEASDNICKAYPGDTISVKLEIFGVNVTGKVEYTAPSTAALRVREEDSQKDTLELTADNMGIAFIKFYRNFDGADAAADWIAGFKVDVASNKLASLTTSAGTMVPSFNSNIYNYTVTLPAEYKDAVPTITAEAADKDAQVNITPAKSLDGSEFDRTATIVVTTPDGKTIQTYKVIFVKNKLVEINYGTDDQPTEVKPTVSENDKNLELPDISDENIAKVKLNLNTGSVQNATVKVTAKEETINGKTQKTAKLPETNITSEKAVIAIPSGTKISGPAEWDGTIIMPTVKAVPSAAVNGNANAVVEVGFGDVELTFDKAVRLLLPGQAGKSAAYVRGGKVTYITRTVTADNQAAADAQLAAGQDGKIDVDSDLVIWTKHFTEFVAYTPTPSSNGGNGGGGGGGGSSFGGTTIDYTVGGKVTASGATVTIPANAYSKNVAVKIEKVSSATSLKFAENTKLVSDVLEITKNHTADFTKPVTITIPFNKKLIDTDKYDLIICYYDTADKEWIALDNVNVDYTNAKVSGETTHFTKFAVIATAKAVEPETPAPQLAELKDIAGNWAEANIKSLVDAGAISGYPDNTFRPNNTITRAEFATVLVKAFGLEAKNGKVFSDTAAHWAKDSIATANAYGIINGYSDAQFGPNDMITREQMAVMIAKAAKLTDTTGARVFADQDAISSWAADAVAAASARQIINGYPDNTFKPQGNATRAEAVTVIVKALNR